MTGLYALVSVGIVGLLALAWRWYRQSCRAVHGCLTRLSAKRGGEVRPATLMTYPQLLFQHGGREVFVSAMPSSGTTYTQVSANPDHTFAQVYFEKPSDFSLELARKSERNPFEDLLSAHPIATGNPAFDALFDLRSNDRSQALALLDGEVQEQSVDLAMSQSLRVAFSSVTLFQNGRLVTGEKRPRLTVSLGGIVADDDAMDRAVTLLLELAGRIARGL